MEKITHSAMLTAWSPMRSKYFVIINRSSASSPSSGRSVMSRIRRSLEASKQRSTISSWSMTDCASATSRRTKESTLSVTIAVASRAMSRIWMVSGAVRPPRQATISAMSSA